MRIDIKLEGVNCNAIRRILRAVNRIYINEASYIGFENYHFSTEEQDDAN